MTQLATGLGLDAGVSGVPSRPPSSAADSDHSSLTSFLLFCRSWFNHARTGATEGSCVRRVTPQDIRAEHAEAEAAAQPATQPAAAAL